MLERVRRIAASLSARIHANRSVVVEGRVAWPGACADRLAGEAHWTLRVTLSDATLGRARLGEPLDLHRRCNAAELHELLAKLPAGARLVARIEFDRGARMRARLCGVLRVEPPPAAGGID